MKKTFFRPEISVSAFSAEDIITASGETPATGAVENLKNEMNFTNANVVTDWNTME